MVVVCVLGAFVLRDEVGHPVDLRFESALFHLLNLVIDLVEVCVNPGVFFLLLMLRISSLFSPELLSHKIYTTILALTLLILGWKVSPSTSACSLS